MSTSSPPVNPRPGYLHDYVTGREIRDTPEERDAVQVFSQRLVEDYGYEKSQLVTHPQFRVRQRPSGGKSFPIDIGVFPSGAAHTEDELFMVVECKKRNRKDGLTQLHAYLRMCGATIGVWFNGEEHVYQQKIIDKQGRVTFRDIPNIPRRGQRLEDIGHYLRKDLRPPSNLKAIFRDLRNYLAGHAVGITRDEALAQQIINLLFVKIFDEINTAPDAMVQFRAGLNEDPRSVRTRINKRFEEVRREYDDVFDGADDVRLDADSLVYVVGELQNYCIIEATRDAVGEAFEVFIGPALRGAEGQFFTPRNVVKMTVEMLDPQPGEKIIDPACGSGGFLITTLEHVWSQVDREAEAKGWSPELAERRRRDVAARYFRGLDKDSFLAKVTKAYMAIRGDGRGGIFCENSLAPPSEWHSAAQEAVGLGTFDVVVTNPPFGKKIKISGAELLAQYDLGHKWKKPRGGEPEPTSVLHSHQPPQMLFIERCVQLLKPGGRLGIVIPESILGNPSYSHVIAWLRQRMEFRAVVTMPEPLFKTSGKGGTHTKVCVLYLQKKSKSAGASDQIFMADVKWCGHDSRGNPTIRVGPDGTEVLLDEVPTVAGRFRDRHIPTQSRDRLGFLLPEEQIRNNILVPKYYNPGIARHLQALEATHSHVTLRELADQKVVSVATGTEVGKMAYGTGDIPFVRTSDLSNWEIKTDFKHGVSRAIYSDHKGKADVAAGDILLVKDGTYLIGTTAIVTESDVPMLYQSHIYRIRVLRPEVMNPWLLFACLNSPIVKRQIRARQFTQDIIDTVGRRIFQVKIPIPESEEERNRIGAETEHIVETRIRLRNRAKLLAIEVEGGIELDDEDLEAMEAL